MRRVIPDALEPWLALVIVVGFFVGTWWRGVSLGVVDTRLDDRVALQTLLVEGAFALVLGLWLWRRGWKVDAMTQPAGPFDVMRGIGLWFVASLAAGLCVGVLYLIDHDYAESLNKAPIQIALTRPMMLAVSILNAVFEEFLWLAYGVTALERRLGRTRACAISLAFRTAIHAYQGVLMFVDVLPLGLVFTGYYALSRRVWPVIVAHALQDALAFALLASMAQAGS